ncbi:MAG: hypothetical protein Q9218_007777 [Villophora microphyllina]
MASTCGPQHFQELKVFANAQQKPSDRFKRTDEGTLITPSLARWRNNLVAFSKYYNLLFIANQNNVLVYKPRGQHVIVTNIEITIDLPKTNTVGAEGYICDTYPHAINHIVVDDLGVEEVIVASCDDGDVVAYTTLSIYQEIDRQRPCTQIIPPIVGWGDAIWTTLQPFFLRNVGMSAWGIAVHKEARMIAVSSNTHKIHVFAFALTTPEVVPLETPSDTEDDNDPPIVSELHWYKVRSPEAFFLRNRIRNVEIILNMHVTNIPSIAFYNPHNNNSRDVFLVSTDINGQTFIWDVWRGVVYDDLHTPIVHHDDRGWGVLCLDPYFYRHVEMPNDLFKGAPTATGQWGVDITNIVHSIVQNSHAILSPINIAVQGFPSATDTSQGPPGNPVVPSVVVNPSNGPVNSMDDFETSSDDSSIVHTDENEESDPEWPYEPINTNQLANSAPITSLTRPSHLESLDGLQSSSDALPQATSPISNALLPFHILHTNKSRVRLFHTIPNIHSIQPPSRLPGEIVCRSPFAYLSPASHSQRLSRLNMIHQIPDLGIVVIGDQIGRVALFSLTRMRSESGKLDEDKFGLRLDRILPMQWEEEAKRRPRADLLGIAVGPIQGHEFRREDGLDLCEGRGRIGRGASERWSADGGRRWRLLMYYNDHTILSYELSRPGRNCDLTT